jgi:hypothetical protein
LAEPVQLAIQFWSDQKKLVSVMHENLDPAGLVLHTASMRISTFLNVHLVSDSTGETLNAVLRAVAP